MPPELVSVLIPAYNEAESLEELFLRTDTVMAALGQAYEFWIIDDGSSDSTPEVAAGLAEKYPSVGYIRQRVNSGKSLALMQGYEAANGDVIVTMDADLQDEPEEIPKLLAALEEGNDLAGGWRHERRDPMPKKLVSWVFNTLVRRVSGKAFKDINCGFKAYTADVMRHLELTGDMHRLIPAIAASYGFKTVEVAISHKPRKYGESRYKLLRYRGILDLISFTVLRATQVRPFHIMCQIGFFCLFVCAVTLAVNWGLLYVPANVLRYLVRSILLGISVITGAISVMSPLFGLVIESIAVGRQNSAWRKSFVSVVRIPQNKNGKGGWNE